MKILFYLSGYDGCGYYRIQMVAKYLNKSPNIHAKISTVYSYEDIKWADLVVLQKQVNQKVLEFVEYALKNGKKIISECDDDYFNIPPFNPAHKSYIGKEQDLINFYMKSSAITVTTGHLGKLLGAYSKTYVLPNCLDYTFLDQFETMSYDILNKYTQYLDCKQQKLTLEYVSDYVKDKVVIGWGGSPTHLKDLDIVTNTLVKICSEYKNVVIMMMGCTTQSILSAMSDSDQLILVEPIPIFRYPQVLRSMPWDIGICPIEDNLFNKSKSNLKFIEFATNGFACVCSNVENYAKTVTNNETGLLVSNDDISWYNGLKFLIDNENERKRIAENGRSFIRNNFNIEKNIDGWIKAYTEVFEKKEVAQCLNK